MTEESRNVVELEHVHAGYGNEDVIKDVSLSIREGEFLGIIGPNGGGKTTLLRVILGLLKPRTGKVRVFGLPAEKAHGRIGYVPQYSSIDPQYPIRVMDVAMMGRLGRIGLRPFYSKEDKTAAANALEYVGMLSESKTHFSNLSGGQKQRVLIARALATEPEILLLDEPTASVDKSMEENIFELLKELNRKVTIVLVSHDIGFISSYVKKIACLNRTLIYHDAKELTPEMLQAVYECPIDIIAHGVPHRVFPHHACGQNEPEKQKPNGG